MPRLPIGILGIGVHLPSQVRRNSDWPSSFAERFSDRRREDITTPDLNVPGADAIVREVLGKYEADVFRGSVERRVLGEGLWASDMEVEAGKQAFEVAGLKPQDIDVLVVSSGIPDMVNPTNSALVHQRLGLRPRAMACTVDASCASFLPSLLLAASHLTATSGRYAMLIQSAACSRVLEYERPLSVNFGDGATAVIVGKVGKDRGILGWSWFNDGSYHRAACVAQAQGEPWWVGKSKQVVGSLDYGMGRGIGLRLGLLCRQAVDAALIDADVRREDVGFFAAHQPTAWFNELCLRTSQLDHVRSATTFSRTASVAAANIALNVDEGTRTGQLRTGDLAMLYSCGMGMNWGAVAMRWGT